MTDQLNGKPFLRSSEVADLAGVSTDTLRHYERKGLIPRPRRSPNGYREYPPATVDRIRLIQRALAVGFTLAELAKILKQRDKGRRLAEKCARSRRSSSQASSSSCRT